MMKLVIKLHKLILLMILLVQLTNAHFLYLVNLFDFQLIYIFIFILKI